MVDPAGSLPDFSRHFIVGKLEGCEEVEKPTKHEVDLSTRGVLRKKGGVAESVEVSVEWIEEDPTLSRLFEYALMKSEQRMDEKSFNSTDPLEKQLVALSTHAGEHKMRPIVARLLFGDSVIGELRNVVEKSLLDSGGARKAIEKKFHDFSRRFDEVSEKVFFPTLSGEEQRRLLAVNERLKEQIFLLERIEEGYGIEKSQTCSLRELGVRVERVDKRTEALFSERQALYLRLQESIEGGERAAKKLVERFVEVGKKISFAETFDIEEFITSYNEKALLVNPLISKACIKPDHFIPNFTGICIGISIHLITLVEGEGLSVEDSIDLHLKKGGGVGAVTNQALFHNIVLNVVEEQGAATHYTFDLPPSINNKEAVKLLIEHFVADKGGLIGGCALEKCGREFLNNYRRNNSRYNEELLDNDLRWAIAAFYTIREEKIFGGFDSHHPFSDPVTDVMMQSYKRGVERKQKVALVAALSNLEVDTVQETMRSAELKNCIDSVVDAVPDLSRGSYLMIFETDGGSHAIAVVKLFDDRESPLYIVDPNGFALKCRDGPEGSRHLKKVIGLYSAPENKGGKWTPTVIKLRAAALKR